MTFENLKIGKIKLIENASNGLTKKALIEPYENFMSINFVMVIIDEVEKI